MNNKWKNVAFATDMGGWVTIPNLLVHDFKRFGLTAEHVAFIIDILTNSETWRIYDEKMLDHGSTRTLNRYRKYLKALGYMTSTAHTIRDEKGQWKSSGFVYNLDGLMDALINNKPSSQLTMGQKCPSDKNVQTQDKNVTIRDKNVQLLRNDISKESINLKNQKDFSETKGSEDRATSGTEGFEPDESVSSDPAFGLVYEAVLKQEDYMDRYSSTKILLRFHQNMKQYIAKGRMYNKGNALATIEANLQQWSENYDNIKYIPNVWRMFPEWKTLTVSPGTFEKFHGFDRLKSNLYDFKDAELREHQRILGADIDLLLAYARENGLPFNDIKLATPTDIQFQRDGNDVFTCERDRKDMIERLWDIYVADTEYDKPVEKPLAIVRNEEENNMSEAEYAEHLLHSIGLSDKEAV